MFSSGLITFLTNPIFLTLDHTPLYTYDWCTERCTEFCDWMDEKSAGRVTIKRFDGIISAWCADFMTTCTYLGHSKARTEAFDNHKHGCQFVYLWGGPRPLNPDFGPRNGALGPLNVFF